MAVICSAVHQDVCACVHKSAKPYSAHVARYVHENNGLVCQYIGYEFIHKVNRRRAHVSKFILIIYIDFRYAGVSTAMSVIDYVPFSDWCDILPSIRIHFLPYGGG